MLSGLLAQFEVRDLITIAISCAALMLSYMTAQRTGRLSAQQLRISKRQGESENKIAAAQAELSREQTRLQRDTEIIRWASDTTALLSEMAELPVTEWEPRPRAERWHRLRHELSTQIDIGRFYFPNYGTERQDDNREPAYRGRRQRLLDHLVAAYDIFDHMAVMGDEPARRACKTQVIAQKRKFISEVQAHIDPHRFVQFLNPDALNTLKEEIEAAAEEDPTPEPGKRGEKAKPKAP